jgi:flagellar capping protein FliD
MSRLDQLIESKRARLERQFAAMESVLANLQSQQASLASFSPISSSWKSTK